MPNTRDNEPVDPTADEQSEAEASKSATPQSMDHEVDDIIKKESDEVLAAEDVIHSSSAPVKQHRGIKGWPRAFWCRKKWTLPLSAVVLIAVILAVPLSRYKVLGLFVKAQFSVVVTDSKTNTPVSGAHLQLAGKVATTDVKGKASVNVPLGHQTLSVSKQYYQSSSIVVLVSLTKAQNNLQVQITATGRQVPVNIVNKITGKAVAGAEIKVLDTDAKTDQNGKAIIVLPTTGSTQPATISLKGYNDTTVQVQVTDQPISANTFTITPTGKVYFLSKLSGKIDVVKTNLDSTGRQTVLAGTGNESDTDTVLLASRDWKYLALISKRVATGNAELSLIDTSSDTTTNIDTGNVSFTLVGWSDHRFVYEVGRQQVSNWQPNQAALKSFNADSKSITLLDQTTASGTNNGDYIREAFGSVYILQNEVVYNKNWDSAFNYANEAQISTKQATLNSIKADGTGKKVVKGFSLTAGTQSLSVNINLQPYKPNSVYIAFSDGSKENFYEYLNGQVTSTSEVSVNTFYTAAYATYLVAPSGAQTFWSEPRDGKNTLFIGDQNGLNGTQIATLSDYDTYGWYTDNYLLVSKKGSELYIMPASGGTALKITDYHKPAQNFNGYGGGYGGR